MSVKSGNEVKVEKLINRPVADVFRALSEGRLFNNCGTAREHMKLDFRVDGHYELGFHGGAAKNCGRFTEIVPNQKIRFTWGDTGSEQGFPRSEVLIELFAEKDKTLVVVHHTGFKSKEDAEGHDYGWNSGLNDLAPELAEGRVRLVRVFPTNREKLYALCSDIRRAFASVSETSRGELDFLVGGQFRFPTKKGEISGKFEEIVPGKKIAFSWLNGCDGPFDKPTRVTFLFDDEEDGESSLELVHELLPDDGAVKSHREGWEAFMSGVYGVVR